MGDSVWYTAEINVATCYHLQSILGKCLVRLLLFFFLCLCSFSGAAEHRWCSIGFGDRLWLHREAGLRESSEVQGYSDIHVYHVALRHYVRMIMFTRIRGLACPHQVVLFLKCVAESAF